MSITRRRAKLRRASLVGKTDTYVHDWESRGYGGTDSVLFSPWGSSTIWDSPTVPQLEKIVKTHPVLRACTYMIATTFAEPKLQIGKEKKGKFTAIPNHPVLKKLENPNSDISGNMLMQMAGIALSTTGIWYLQKVRVPREEVLRSGKIPAPGSVTEGEVETLYSWPSSWVTELETDSIKDARPVSGYTIQGQEEVIPPENMMRIWIPSPDHPWRPSSPALSAYNDARLDQERENYQSEMILNSPVASVGINTGIRPPQQRQMEKFEDEIQNRFGRGRRGRPFIFAGDGAKIEEVHSLRDMDWPGMNSTFETRICMALGVPPILIGARSGLERSTYSNYRLAQMSFYSETMRPLWIAVADGLTRELLYSEGITDLKFRFDIDSLPALSEAINELTERMINLKYARIIGTNESRLALGFPSLGPEYDGLDQRTEASFEGDGSGDGEDSPEGWKKDRKADRTGDKPKKGEEEGEEEDDEEEKDDASE